MKKILLAAFVASFSFSFAGEESPRKIHWKNGARAAVCLTYDDGMGTHLANAIPQLDNAGLKGTFFLNAVSGTGDVVGWKHAALKGHELGNHSLFHPCPVSFGWDKLIATDHYTVPQILREIATVNELLAQLDPARTTRAYSYPCNVTEVGGKSYVADLLESKLASCARTGSGAEKIIVTDFARFDKMLVPSWAVPEGVELKDLIAFAERAREAGGLAVFQFHGVGGQWIQVSSEVHQGFVNYLAEHAADYWVGTFSETVAYIEAAK